jgi:pyruvate formate lyase activating enzyme
MQKQALFFTPVDEHIVRCELCPHFCQIRNQHTGDCRTRCNSGGVLISENYGRLTAVHSDPIEKKPLYHFYPGSEILSAGSFGCNLHCSFCQNHDISQVSAQQVSSKFYTPEEITKLALNIQGNIGLAYTYNEPTVFYEFMIETAELIRKAGKKNVMVSNGFINPEPLERLTDIIDGFNIDLKFFSAELYRKICGGKLESILSALKKIRSSGKHLEITHLLVPGLNDDAERFKQMIAWIEAELGEESILHLSRYYPQFHCASPPTPESKLVDFYHIATEKLKYVYLGNINVPGKGDTLCASCGKTVIRRSGYFADAAGLDKNGHCRHCNHKIALMQ